MVLCTGDAWEVPLDARGFEPKHDLRTAMQGGLAMVDTPTGAYHSASLPLHTRCWNGDPLDGDPPRLCGWSSSGLLLVYHTAACDDREEHSDESDDYDALMSVNMYPELSVFTQEAVCSCSMPMPTDWKHSDAKPARVAGWAPTRDQVLFYSPSSLWLWDLFEEDPPAN